MKINGVDYTIKSGREKGTGNDAIKITAKKGSNTTTISIYAGANNKYEATDRIETFGTLALNREFITSILEKINEKSNDELDDVSIDRPEDSVSSFVASNIRKQNSNPFITMSQLLSEANGSAKKQREAAKTAKNVKLNEKNLKNLGFSDEQTKMILKLIKTLDNETKNAIMQKMVEISNSMNDEYYEIDEEIQKVFQKVFLYSKRNIAEIASINGVIYSELKSNTGNNEKLVKDTITKLTPYNILETWKNFNYSGDTSITNIAQALADDFNDTPEVISPAYKHILECITKRAEILGIELNDSKLINATTMCSGLTESSADDYYVEGARDALKALIWDLNAKEKSLKDNLN